MTNTTYYNLNIVEGSDIVNPLTVDNPNYEIIDRAMHDNGVAGVTLATEIANATVHAITRVNSECAVIRFIATSEWKAGDTVTVDGVPVTALLPSGETLPSGAYVINANVLCILTGTYLTVYAERKKIDNASEIKYNDTNVAEAITNAAEAITKVNNKLEWKRIGSVVGTGRSIALPIETYNEFLIITGTPVYKWTRHFTKNELNTFVAINDSYYHPTSITNNSPSAQVVRATISASNEISLEEVWQNGVKNDETGTLVVYGK